MDQALNSIIDHAKSGHKLDVGNLSDGYHTFNELYNHRHMLFMTMMKLMPYGHAWISKRHSDGEVLEGWFIAGIDLPNNPPDEAQITYHLPERLWGVAKTCARELECGKEWDGHTSDDVLRRLNTFIEDIPF